MANYEIKKHAKNNSKNRSQQAIAQKGASDTPLKQIMRRAGGGSSAQAHSLLLRKTSGSNPTLASEALITLQREYGNSYVQRVVNLSRKPDNNDSVSPEIEQSIQQARNGGQALDRDVRRQMESSFGADFSNVRVHNNAEADTLNRALNSRAFTTAQDIFFKSGEYNYGSSNGRELLAHELTHVVQQTGGIQRKLKIGQADDKYEQEADQVAREVVQDEHQPNITKKVQVQPLVQKQEEEKKEENKDKAIAGQTSTRNSMINFTGDGELAEIFKEATGVLDVLIHSQADAFLLHNKVSSDVNQLVKEVIEHPKFKTYLEQKKGKQKILRLIACSAGGKAADVPWAKLFADKIRHKTGFNKKQLRIKAAQNVISTIQHPGGPNGEWVSEWRIIGGGKWKTF